MITTKLLAGITSLALTGAAAYYSLSPLNQAFAVQNDIQEENPDITIENKDESGIKGDINSDGKADITDLSELALALVGDQTFTETQKKAADVDGDGEVKLSDLAKFRQYLSKVIEFLE